MSNESCDTCKPQTGDVDTTLINETGTDEVPEKTDEVSGSLGTGTGTDNVPEEPKTSSVPKKPKILSVPKKPKISSGPKKPKTSSGTGTTAPPPPTESDSKNVINFILNDHRNILDKYNSKDIDWFEEQIKSDFFQKVHFKEIQDVDGKAIQIFLDSTGLLLKYKVNEIEWVIPNLTVGTGYLIKALNSVFLDWNPVSSFLIKPAELEYKDNKLLVKEKGKFSNSANISEEPTTSESVSELNTETVIAPEQLITPEQLIVQTPDKNIENPIVNFNGSNQAENFISSLYASDDSPPDDSNNLNERIYAAQNPNTPVNILVELSTDENVLVRQAIALNPNTPLNILEKLSNDTDHNVLVNIAKNPNVSVKLLEKLLISEYSDVQLQAQKNLIPSVIPKIETPQEYSGFTNLGILDFSNQQFGEETLLQAKVRQPSSKIPNVVNPLSSSNTSLIPTVQSLINPQKDNSGDQQLPNFLNFENYKPVSEKIGNNKQPVEIPQPIEAGIKINLNSPLNSIKSSFNKILDTSKKLFTLISGKIKKKSDDIKTDKKEKSDEESKKPKKSKLQKKVESIWDSIIGFLKDIVKAIIQYKLLEWMSNPENIKKFTRIIRFLSGVIQFFVNIGKFITSAFLNSIGLLTTGINFIVDVIKGIISIFDTVGNFMIDFGIDPLLRLFEYIPILFDGLVDFFTKTLPQAFALEQPAAAAEIPTEEESTPNNKLFEDNNVDGIKKFTERDIEKRKSEEEKRKSKSSPPLAIFSGTINSEQTETIVLEKMAKGGIVQKPTPALIGEAGPEAIIPLSNITNSSLGINNEELSNTTSKIVPEFTKLLLLPFKVIGAGIISTVQGIANEYPSIMPLIGNEISTIANVFGVPKTIVNVATKDFGKIDLNNLNNFNETENILTLFGQSPKINESTTNSDQNSENETQFRKQNDDSVRGLLGDILNALIYKNSKKNSSSSLSIGGSPSGTPPELIPKISEKLSPKTASAISNPTTAFTKELYKDPKTEEDIAKGITESYKDETYTISPTPDTFDGVEETGTGWSISKKDGTKLVDYKRWRPVVLSKDAATDFDAMISSSNNYVKSDDITSSKRSKAHNDSLSKDGSSTNSKHLVGEALDVDLYSTTALWMAKYGSRFNWHYVYHGPNHIHFEHFRKSQDHSSLSEKERKDLENTLNKSRQNLLPYPNTNEIATIPPPYVPIPQKNTNNVLNPPYDANTTVASANKYTVLTPIVNNSNYNKSTDKFAFSPQNFPNIPYEFFNPHAA